MKRNYKKIAAAAGIFVFLLLMFLWLTGSLSTKPKIAPGKVEPPVSSAEGKKTIAVTAVTMPQEVEAVGTVNARESVEISSRMMATITKVNVAAGDTIKKGETLIELDSRDVNARLAQAKQARASAEAALERAKLDAGRIERLHEKQAATGQEYDAAQASLKMAQASLESAKAAVREAEANLSYTKVESPVDGRVVDRHVDPGDMSAPGQSLMTIYVPTSLRLEAPVAEQLRPKVKLGDEIRASIDTVGDFTGKIVEIVPASDIASRSFTVRVSIPPSITAYSGMYGRIRIPVGTTQRIIIPTESIEHVGQLDMVTVVTDDQAQSRLVKTGRTYPEGIEILSGLSPGERIVAQEYPRDGHEQQ
jgi:RND family efflux transporter MFP subunit